MAENTTFNGLEIAIIGMSGRFPGAKDIDRFWENLKNGVESISFFSDEELIETGIDFVLLENPHYIKASGELEDIDCFDSAFFGYIPREAEVMDPQTRIFHECVWNALEDAGYDPDRYSGLIGLYAGASPNFNWEALAILGGSYHSLGTFGASTLVDKDFLYSKISFHLNLKGPSFSLYTACSTSLVAVHLACQAILNGECDIALAGGVTVSTLGKNGYPYQEGMIYSSDGHCRTFDAKASGTVAGNGSAVVVLKRLEDALADRDYICAVIKGSAINNDGTRKVGYEAPSVEGQYEVLRAALQMAEVEPESIGYIETHGTATKLGDPIEFKALKRVFDFGPEKKKHCALGAVKTNVGHLDAAAGVAGLIKVVLSLQHKQIPPGLHFNTPNPELDLENSPFYVNNKLIDWKNDRFPLRAGVSSFGIGGTNAHVILEEAPEREKSSETNSPYLLLLSAKTESALKRSTENLAKFFKGNPGINMADVAYTLQVGRKKFEHKKMVVCPGVREAGASLSSQGTENIRMHFSPKGNEENPVIFMFSGQGSQYANMGWELYKHLPAFREEMQCCFEILKPLLEFDIKKILYPQSTGRNAVKETFSNINQTEIAQPALFIIEYSLARVLIKWGIRPYAMIGHSIGEYVAACLSGVFTLEDALEVVVLRGRLMQGMPVGAMLSVSITEEELNTLLMLNKNEEISLAAVNGSSFCVVSGVSSAIDEFANLLKQKGYDCSVLRTSHAFHSGMMDPVLEEFREAFKKIQLGKPQIPYISNLTGNWITVGDAADPRCWANHLRRTVRFGDGLERLLKQKNSVLAEIGPGETLCTFVRRHHAKATGHKVINLLRPPKKNVSDMHYLMDKVGQLWLYGQLVDWEQFYQGQRRHRIPLPVYSFEKMRYPAVGNALQIGTSMLMRGAGTQYIKKEDMADWFYVPSWKRSHLPGEYAKENPLPHKSLVFIDDCGVGSRLIKRLNQCGGNVIVVKSGSKFAKEDGTVFIINPKNKADYDTLFKQLKQTDEIPDAIIHLWGVTGNNILLTDLKAVEHALDLGFYSLLYIAQAIGTYAITNEIRIKVVTDGMLDVMGGEETYSEKSTVLGPVKIIGHEFNNLLCQAIDIQTRESATSYEAVSTADIIERLMKELRVDSSDKVIAFRGNHRWKRDVEAMRLEKPLEITPRLREKGVYFIAGGVGGIGLGLAEYLAEKVRARLILTSRSVFPEQENWQTWLDTNDTHDKISNKIRKLQKLERLGAEIVVRRADITDMEQMKKVIAEAGKRFGGINGVIHSAGVADAGIIQLKTREMADRVLASKVKGTLVLDRIFKDTGIHPDFFAVCSSLGSILERSGQAAYTAANTFLDTFAHNKNKKEQTFAVSINWETWREAGMAFEAARAAKKPDSSGSNPSQPLILEDGLSTMEGKEVFHRILAYSFPQVLVSIKDLNALIRHLNYPASEETGTTHVSKALTAKSTEEMYQRPELNTPYVPPQTDNEKLVAQVWQELFGVKKVGINDDFFELGGSSLLAIQMVNKLKERNIEITIDQIYLNSTIHKICRDLAGIKSPGEDVSVITSFLAEKYGGDLLYKLFRVNNVSTKVLFFLNPGLHIDDILENITDKWGSHWYPNFIKQLKSESDIINDEEIDEESFAKAMELKNVVTQEVQEKILSEMRKNNKMASMLLESDVVRVGEASPVQKLDMLTSWIEKDFLMVSMDFSYPLDFVKIKKIISEFIDDNSLLRTIVVRSQRNFSLKEYGPFRNFELPFIDISEFSPKCKREIIKKVNDELHKPLDINANLMYRLCLVKFDQRTYKLLIVLNHTIVDAESIPVLQNKLGNRSRGIKDENKKGYWDFIEFLDKQDYENIQLTEFFDFQEYWRSAKKINTVFGKHQADIKDDDFEIDISNMDNPLKTFYNEVILYCFAELTMKLFEIEKVPISFVSGGRIYKDGKFQNIIGDFHDNIPVLFDFSRGLDPKGMIEKYIDYKSFITDKNLHFSNLLLKKNLYAKHFKHPTPLIFNGLIYSYDRFIKRESDRLRRQRIQEALAGKKYFHISMLQNIHKDKVWITLLQSTKFENKKVREGFLEIYQNTVNRLKKNNLVI